MQQTSPGISVVMATYNGERFLQAQLASILHQTLPPNEIIIVDDGSTDNTVALLTGYARADSRIVLLINERNIGYIRSFEKGMQQVTCALTALSDQDDIWLPQKLETLYNQLNHYSMVYSDSELIDAEGNKLNQRMSGIRNQLAYHTCLMYTIGAWAPGHAMLFKSALIQKCLPFPALTTHDFWLGFNATCYDGIQYVATPLVLYRQHASNAIGANTSSIKKNKPTRKEKLYKARKRMQLLYEKCPVEKRKEKEVLRVIVTSYQSFSLVNNWTRMVTFFKYRDLILAYKKKSAFMKILFCGKMFFKID